MAKNPQKKKMAAKKTPPKKTDGKKAPQNKKTSRPKPTNRKSASAGRRNSRIVKSILTAEELSEFRQLLLEKRIEILGCVDSIENESLKKSRLDAAGDLSSMPIHMADIGTDNFEQEFALGLMHSERKILTEINAALKRIDDGTYGICEGTGNPIPKSRLKASPWARYCIEYAQLVEKGLADEGNPLYNSRYDKNIDDQLDDFDEDEELEDFEKIDTKTDKEEEELEDESDDLLYDEAFGEDDDDEKAEEL